MCAIDIVKNRRLKICESSRQRTVERNRFAKKSLGNVQWGGKVDKKELCKRILY